MSLLRCINEECSTRTEGDQATFSVLVVVDEKGCLAESTHEIAAKFFECNICHSTAERITT